MMWLFARAACAAALVLSGCANGPSIGRSDRDAVLKVLEGQVGAWNRGDLDGFLAGYVRSSEVTFYSGKSPLKGFEPLHERYRARYASEGKEMGRLEFSEIEIDLLGPDAAVARARWRVKMSAEELDGLFTVILKRFSCGWRIVHDHTSG